MSKIVTPEALLNSQVEEFNKGNISFLMTLYEKDACFASKPGDVVKGLESIRRTLTGRGTVVLRRQSDDTWLMVIENPWGTD